MEYVIHPHVGAGPLRFGMNQAEVRLMLPGPHESFMKSAASEFPTDSFQGGLHAFYREPGILEAIEFYRPCRVIWNSHNLIGVPYSQIKQLALANDDALDEDGAGFVSRRLGFGVYAPAATKCPDDPTESVIVFEEGYYDR